MYECKVITGVKPARLLGDEIDWFSGQALGMNYSSSTSRCRAVTFRLNSSISLSQSSAASPFRGEALRGGYCG